MAADPQADREDRVAAFLQPLFERYLHHLTHARRYSAHTVAAARADLAGFGAHCQAAGVTALAQIDSHLVRAWLGAQHRRGASPGSLHRYLSSLRGFFREMLRHGHIASNPAQTVRAPRMRRRLPAVIAAEPLNAALDRAPQEPLDVRDHAIVELFYSAGLRLSELWALDLTDVDGRELVVTGKGNKQRVAMIGAPARRALDAWLRLRSDDAVAGETALFVSQRGGRLSRAAIAGALRRWAQRRELGQHLHPHRLRHSFATHLLENSGDLRAVQELLGHAHLSTTQIYTQLDWKRLAAIYDGAHPRARRTRTGD